MDEAIERAVHIMARKEVQWFEELLSSLSLALENGIRDEGAETALEDIIKIDPPEDPVVRKLYDKLLRKGNVKKTSGGEMAF